MQVSMNTNYSDRQNFGMALHSSDAVNKVLRTRIKTPAQLQDLSELIDQASKNEIVDVLLFSDKKGKLSANVYTVNNNKDNPNRVLKTFTEGFFGGPIKFIRKVVNLADDEAAIIEKRCDVVELNNVLGRMLK